MFLLFVAKMIKKMIKKNEKMIKTRGFFKFQEISSAINPSFPFFAQNVRCLVALGIWW